MPIMKNKNDEFIGVRVPKPLKKGLERKAKKEGFEFSDFIRMLFKKVIGK